MKFSITLLAAAVAMASAQEAKYRPVKERLMEIRKDRSQTNVGTSIEHIKNHHRARMEKIQEMIHERVAMLESHESGNRRLNDEEHARATRQVVNFQRKLDSMKASNTDEHHLERLDEMASLHNLESIDHLDFKEDLINNLQKEKNNLN